MLDKSQLNHMRDTQALSLMDTCRRLMFVSSRNDYNEVIGTFIEEDIDIPCGIDQRQGEERGRDKDTVIVYDAIIRLPLNTIIDEKDRIKLIKRYGERMTEPIIYDVISPAQQGPSGLRFLLKRSEL